MRLRRSVVPLGGALLAGLAIWAGPAGAAYSRGAPGRESGEGQDHQDQDQLGHRRNLLFGTVYSHNTGCVGARRTRVFAVTGSSRRLLDTDKSVR